MAGWTGRRTPLRAFDEKQLSLFALPIGARGFPRQIIGMKAAGNGGRTTHRPCCAGGSTLGSHRRNLSRARLHSHAKSSARRSNGYVESARPIRGEELHRVLLEVDLPEKLTRHNFAASPPFFSFGDYNRHAVLEREGLSMLAFASDDARADIRGFSAARLPTFAPFDFERHAKLPDGARATVAFSLAFVQSPEMPKVAFFVSQNRVQGNFWKSEYQSHANGAAGIVAVYLSSPAPERDAAFVSKMFGGNVSPVRGGFVVACGRSQELRVLTPQAMAERDSSGGVGNAAPILAGIALATHKKKDLIPAAEASGMFIEWVSP
jgi:hypothetical protein